MRGFSDAEPVPSADFRAPEMIPGTQLRDADTETVGDGDERVSTADAIIAGSEKDRPGSDRNNNGIEFADFIPRAEAVRILNGGNGNMIFTRHVFQGFVGS
jgi:hypothetical protein